MRETKNQFREAFEYGMMSDLDKDRLKMDQAMGIEPDDK